MMLQCGREYLFGNDKEPAQATQLPLLTNEELAYLPTNNIPSERVFLYFFRKATAAKCSNQVQSEINL